MTNEITLGGSTYSFDSTKPIDISIPLQFNGPQPNAYGVEAATSTPCSAGDLIGDTRQGGSCNFERYTLIPHCNGTHTECVGHITHERISVGECLQDIFIPALLISVEPKDATSTIETYSVAAGAGDTVITRAAIEASLDLFRGTTVDSLIIRTVPNDDAKLTRQYGTTIPPYFTTDAMQYIVERGIRHLLVDLPSIDRLYDEGRLSNHRIFWKVDQGSFELTEIARRSCTITELVYVPNDVRDGSYILNLQIAPFASDASPSRPILFLVNSES